MAEQLVVVDDSAAAAIFHPSLYAAAVLNRSKYGALKNQNPSVCITQMYNTTARRLVGQCGNVSTCDLHNKMRCKGEAGTLLELLHVLLPICWIGNL